jgi:hypothetical protein
MEGVLGVLMLITAAAMAFADGADGVANAIGAPKPTIAPAIECVVDTGQPREEAIISQNPAANNDANIP